MRLLARPGRRPLPLALVVLAGLVLAAAPALAGPSPQRTVRVRLAKTGDPNGASGQPAASGDARFVAFASRASNLGVPDRNKHVRDVYVYDQGTGAIRMLSRPPGDAGADGPSGQPVLDGDGIVAAFTSRARNLVAGDANKASDVFVAAFGGLALASVAPDGTPGDGASSEPDLSSDGHLLVFSSTAKNLVAGDDNRRRDVFVRDLAAGTTRLVSAAAGGGAANGDSRAPAISPDGRYVSYTSKATNLVAHDRNHAPDVFVTDLKTGATTLVSVAGRSRQQNASVAKPFHQVSDISRDGRYVAFDSDATNLVRHDRNGRTDVFVRDLRRHRTRRASLATTDQEAGGDSFTPRISANGRWVAFVSAADDLVPRDAIGMDVFLRDLRHHTTSVVDVSSHGVRRGRELVKGVLDRPAMSDDASTVLFASSARGLAATDRRRFKDVFLRRMTPPASAFVADISGASRGRLLITFRSGDRNAWPLRCRLDHRPPTLCPLDGMLLPRLKRGRHVLRAYAGAPGMMYARKPIVIILTVRHGHVRTRVRGQPVV